MNLIQETEISKKKSNNSLLIIFMTVIAVFLGFWCTVLTSMGIVKSLILLDFPTLLVMLIVVILFLLGTKSGRSFFNSFKIVTGRAKDISETEILQAKASIWLVSNTLLLIGILESVVGVIAIAWSNMETTLSAESLGASIAIALIGILYGLIGYLLLLPIRIKLEMLCSKE